MKNSDMILIFSGLLFVFLIFLHVKQDTVASVSQSKLEYNRIIDNAVDDALLGSIEGVDTSGNAVINKEEAVDNFMNSLYVGFGIMDSREMKEKLKGYIPVIALVDYDGYYICSYEEYKDSNNDTVMDMVWKPKKLYTYSTDKYIYSFTLTDYVSIYDITNKKTYEGKYQDILKYGLNDDSVLKDYDTFDFKRKSTIIDNLVKDMKYYINLHNDKAKYFGINYSFTLPLLDKNSWYRTIEDISFLALFQGMPVVDSNHIINRFSFGGARLLKTESYYIQKDPVTGFKYYHKANCPNLTDKSLMYNTREAAALEGAFPCEICFGK